MHKSLLALESDLERAVPQSHIGSSLLGSNGAILVLILDESDTLASSDHANFLKARKSRKDGRQFVLTVAIGNTAQEYDLVGRQVFVWDDARTSTSSALETSTTSGFDGLALCFLFQWSRSGAFGRLCSLCCFSSLFALCEK